MIEWEEINEEDFDDLQDDFFAWSNDYEEESEIIESFETDEDY